AAGGGGRRAGKPDGRHGLQVQGGRGGRGLPQARPRDPPGRSSAFRPRSSSASASAARPSAVRPRDERDDERAERRIFGLMAAVVAAFVVSTALLASKLPAQSAARRAELDPLASRRGPERRPLRRRDGSDEGPVPPSRSDGGNSGDGADGATPDGELAAAASGDGTDDRGDGAADRAAEGTDGEASGERGRGAASDDAREGAEGDATADAGADGAADDATGEAEADEAAGRSASKSEAGGASNEDANEGEGATDDAADVAAADEEAAPASNSDEAADEAPPSEDDDEDEESGPRIIHVLETRFMQMQPSLVELARARLRLFRTVCLPSVTNQTARGRFVWTIRTDPELDEEVKEELAELLEEAGTLGRGRTYLLRATLSAEAFRDVRPATETGGPARAVLPASMFGTRQPWTHRAELLAPVGAAGNDCDHDGRSADGIAIVGCRGSRTTNIGSNDNYIVTNTTIVSPEIRPFDYRDMLSNALSKPQTIFAGNASSMQELFEEASSRHGSSRGERDVVVWTRLDADDGLNLGFVEYVQGQASSAPPWPPSSHFPISQKSVQT
ncbi:hypothetical protein ACHAWF_008435, partial [Thalassiosira exigua]